MFSSMAGDATYELHYECFGDPDAILAAMLPAPTRWDTGPDDTDEEEDDPVEDDN